MAQTTLIPFTALPPCATSCGHLYDANGACVPPAKPTGDLGSYAACFCADPRVAPFSAGPSGVCDAICTNPGETGAMTSIQQWFTSFCSANAKGVAEGGQQTTNADGSVSTTAPKAKGPGGDWLSGHWQWVVFIVVVVVGIAAIWVGACIFRRRYLRKKDRQYALGKAAGGGLRPSQGGPAGGGPPGMASQRSVHMPSAGLFAPASISAANVYDVGNEKHKVKKERKKWVVTERT